MGRSKEAITLAEVTNRLSVTDQKVTQLTGEVEKQTKSATDNSGLPPGLMVGIENLGENMKTMKVELICLGDRGAQEAEEELNRLHDPVSLTIPVSKAPEVVNLLSSDNSFPSPTSHPEPHPDLFRISRLEDIPVASMAQEDTGVRPPTPITERVLALRQPRPGGPAELVCDDSVHPAFNFRQVQASRPQVFTSSMAIQPS